MSIPCLILYNLVLLTLILALRLGVNPLLAWLLACASDLAIFLFAAPRRRAS